MRFLTEDAVLVCAHELGVVEPTTTQRLVTINGRKVQVARNPESRPINRCPNIGITIKPCTSTLKVQVGYSTFMRIDGKAMCLDTVKGLTDGTPPGVVEYKVRLPGQRFVSGSA